MRILFLPAFACDAGLYEDLASELGSSYEGRTVVPVEPTMAACAAAVLDAAGHEPFIVCGTSFGGHVARELALAAPERVSGLVVMGAGAAAPADPTALQKRASAIAEGREAAMLEDMARAIVFEPEGAGQAAADRFRAMASRFDRGTLSAQTAALASRPDHRQALPSIRCPSLLIWGEQDAFSPPAAGLKMAEAIRQAEFLLLPRCGHLPSLERTKAVAAAIRRRFTA